MRQIALLALLLAFAAAVYGQENILEKGLEGRSAADVISRRYVTPLRLVALPGELTAGVENPEALLRNFDGQLTTGTPDVCRLSTRDGRSASVLLDFGKELCGGIALSAAIRADQRALKVRIRLGESVSEAMSDVGGDAPMASATNEHSLRDFTLGVPWLGNVEAGNSGFRFVRIDLVEPDAELNLKAVRAILRYRDVPYLGSFRCDDERLNRIWETGAYTVHLNMQEYLWDGVKRDRLVWLGDMHPEVMTVQSVFGGNEVVRRSLDHVRDNTPLPGWMNWIAAYSMWWVIIHRDLYMYEGDLNYLGEQQEYMRGLLRVLASQMDGDRENLQGGQRLLPHLFAVVGKGRGRDAGPQRSVQRMGGTIFRYRRKQGRVHALLPQRLKKFRHCTIHLDALPVVCSKPAAQPYHSTIAGICVGGVRGKTAKRGSPDRDRPSSHEKEEKKKCWIYAGELRLIRRSPGLPSA